jgi:hypothetical protein
VHCIDPSSRDLLNLKRVPRLPVLLVATSGLSSNRRGSATRMSRW